VPAPDLAELSLNTATVKRCTLAQAIEGSARHGPAVTGCGVRAGGRAVAGLATDEALMPGSGVSGCYGEQAAELRR